MKPTVRDVAKTANVSVATVSRIINNIGGYSESTKTKVLKVMEDMGYEINELARGLSTNSTKIIGVLLPDSKTSVFVEVLKGIESIAYENGYNVMYCNTGEYGHRNKEHLKMLLSIRVAGVIYASVPFTDNCYDVISKSGTPCVLALTKSYKYQIPYVKVDDQEAAYSATKYLIDRGHRKIALIATELCEEFNDTIAGKQRFEGYKRALRDCGIDVDESLIEIGDNSYESGSDSIEKIYSRNNKFTAVFAVSDDMAIGAMNKMKSLGKRIPEDISIVGYDNTVVAKMSSPGLTTVDQMLYNIGQKAAKKLIDLIKENVEMESTIIRHRIFERGSVAELK